MDDFDATTLSVLEAADVDEEALLGLTREDLKDLFPGSENFLRRKKLWDFMCQKSGSAPTDVRTCERDVIPATTAVSPCQPQISTTIITDKKMKMPDPPEYVVYTDSELEMVRSQYFVLLRNGKEKDCNMSKELCCRLVRNTITSMVAILRASSMGKEVKYPSRLEMRAMSQKVVEYYPMLRDSDTDMPYLTIYTKMYKRLQNIRSPKKRQGSMPQRGRTKKTLFSSESTSSEADANTSGTSDSTILLEDESSEDSSTAQDQILVPSKSVSSSSPKSVTPQSAAHGDKDFGVQDSRKMQARHYKTLSKMYMKPKAKPNQIDVAHLLDLEFEARQSSINGDVTREENRASKIFEAYPCFKEVKNAMDELRRIVGGANLKYIDEMRGRWKEFCAKVQFFGVWKKALKPPFPLDVRGVGFTVALINALPSLFPSPTPPPKRLGSASEALLHVLKQGEDPTIYLEKRPLSSPVLLFDGTTSLIAVGNTPVSPLPPEDFCEGLLIIMAYYYTLHLTYPKCVATLLSVIQTEVIGDAIHDKDATSFYKKAIAEWKSFTEQ